MQLIISNAYVDDITAYAEPTCRDEHDLELTFKLEFPPDDCADVKERVDGLLSMMGRPLTVILDDAGGEVIVNG